MDVVKAYSGRSLFWSVFFMGLLCALVNGALYVALDFVTVRLSALSGGEAELTELRTALELVSQYYIPASAALFLLFALLLWLCSRLSLAKLIKKYVPASPKKPADRPRKPSEADKKEKVRHDQRLFLHLISVLQREGRLMDFFAEDLEEYDDEDIGAAVRDIHEKCKKVVEKYLTAEAVVPEDEEETITVPPGFDPNAIKLTGNVTGEPPFEGVVRHRGWKARKLELPALSGDRDPGIIAPAEVEIL